VRRSVEHPLEAVRGYPKRTLREFDLGSNADLNAVTPTDIGRLLVIEALNQDVALALLDRGESAPWHLVPADARLPDADPEGDLYWDASELYKHFMTVDGVGDAIASKLLHIKRPASFRFSTPFSKRRTRTTPWLHMSGATERRKHYRVRVGCIGLRFAQISSTNPTACRSEHCGLDYALSPIPLTRAAATLSAVRLLDVLP
jgi:hypothetical protein